MARCVKQGNAGGCFRLALSWSAQGLERTPQPQTLGRLLLPRRCPNRQTAIINALDQTTTIAYDAAGEKISATDPLDHTTTYGYNMLGQLATVTDPLGDTIAYGYDAYGDQIAITQGGPSNPSMTASMVYNQVHEEVNYIDYLEHTYTYTYDGDGNQTTIIDPNTNTTTNTYNPLNQLISVKDPLGNVTTYGYDADGNRTTVEDPLTRITTTVYDAQGRVLTVTDPLNGTTTYTYDLAGNQTSITDPDDNTTTYTYDAVNRLSSTINPMGYTATYDYDAAGEWTATTDADGRTTTYSYDAVGRKIGETWVHGGYVATWSYDAAGNLSTAQDTYSSYQYGYDAANRLTSVGNSGTPGVPQVTLTYSYDNYNDRTGMTDSLGGSISYSYDSDNRLTSLGLSVSGKLGAQVTFGYDPASRLTGITRSVGDTIVTTLTYDNANPLANMATADTTTSVTLTKYTYGYDKASQLTDYQDNNGSSLTYSYDNNGELTGASGTLNGSNYSVTYSYDANGNRNMTGYSTGKGNELTSDGTYDYTYDNNGNMTSQTNISTRVVTTYTWDYRNRLTEVQVGSSTETFTYDVNNNRIGTSANGTTTWTVYDGSNPYIDFNGSGTLTERYLTNPNELNQFYGQIDANGNTQWFLTDNLGSIRQVVNASNGNVLATITYDPYGNILTQLNSSAPRFLYAGGAYDAITDTYLDGAREDNPVDGRWLSQDPLGFMAGDTNLYRYVFNAPNDAVDPSGLSISDYWQPGAFFGSLASSIYSIGLTYKGIYQYVTGNPNAADTFNQAYEFGPLGQTQNGPAWAYYGTRGALGVATVATASAVCVGATEVVFLGNQSIPASVLWGGSSATPVLTPAQREITASLNRLQQMREIMVRLEAAYQRAIERNLPAAEQLARQAIENQAKRIAAEEAWFEFLLGGLP